MKQKIVTLVEALLEIEDLVIIPDPCEIDKKDLHHAILDFTRILHSLTLEFLDSELVEIKKQIEELKNEKK